jgi:ribosomal protein S18 acetylase RimI-like enzyme
VDTYLKYHVVIHRGQMLQVEDRSTFSGLCLEKLEKNFSSFRMLIERVGGPWGWTRRPRYYGGQVSVRHLLRQSDSRMYLCKRNGVPIGYTFIVPASNLLRPYVGQDQDLSRVVEIENFGLFPEFTGFGYGRYFLREVFKELFESYDTIYLSTRSTNHAKVVPFYEEMGMKVVAIEEYPDDLYPEDEKIFARRVVYA